VQDDARFSDERSLHDDSDATSVTTTLEDAVKILNERRHHGHSNWYVCGQGDDALVRGEDQYEVFEPFEAIAIAEKYKARITSGPSA
jgi:hypothetical protein